MHSVVKQCISDAGSLAQAFGLGRVPGQIYAYLYFAGEPRGLADMQDALHISKGSASMCVRQLEQWGAARKIWVKGDRRDYYVANDWFGRVLKNVLTDIIAKRLADRDGVYADLGKELDAGIQDEQTAFIRERLAHLRRFESKALQIWNNPLVKTFLR